MPPNSRSERMQNHKIKGTDKVGCEFSVFVVIFFRDRYKCKWRDSLKTSGFHIYDLNPVLDCSRKSISLTIFGFS